MIVVAREYFVGWCTLPYRPTPAGLPGRGPRGRVSANRRQAIRLVTEEDVRDFFHQRGAITSRAVRRIQDHDAPTIRQRSRASAAGPFIRGITEEMLARLRREALDAIEINDHEFGKAGQREWIERLFVRDAGKVSQAERAQLELFSFFGGR